MDVVKSACAPATEEISMLDECTSRRSTTVTIVIGVDTTCHLAASTLALGKLLVFSAVVCQVESVTAPALNLTSRGTCQHELVVIQASAIHWTLPWI